MKRKRNEIVKFIWTELVALLMIFILSILLYEGFSIDKNYERTSLPAIIFCFFFIAISCAFLIFNVIDLTKQLSYFHRDDEDKNIKLKVFVIYLASIYVLGILFAIFFE